MICRLDLSGEWGLFLDREMKGELPAFSDTMTLPGTTSYAKKGEYNDARETGYLTDTYKFEGDAWFSKRVDFDRVRGEVVKLFLERTRRTAVYIDGELVGRGESLCTPHIYDLSRYAGTGEHEIAVCVSNKGYRTGGGHLTSADTQTNWNGITGRIELQGFNRLHITEMRVTPDVGRRSFFIEGSFEGGESGELTVCAESFNAGGEHRPEQMKARVEGGRFEIEYPLGEEALLWSEHSPALYRLRVSLDGDETERTVGLREFGTRDGKFTINGRTTFLRGKHDGMIFPKTGFAPCGLDEWLRVMSIARSFGINHYRFHTCCPPEAAFEAADMLGIYMEPQLPFWGTIAAPGEEGYNGEEQEFLISEGFAMLRAFGDHPSYCMMSMGNELWGSPERINEIIGGFKSFDGRHLYTQGSNNFQWFPNVVENDDFFVGVRLAKDRLIRGSYAMCDAPLGHVQTEKPGTMHDYDGVIRPTKKALSSEASEDGTVQIQFGTTMKTVKASEADADFVPKIPIVTHEIGQYETYPDFSEIEKYTGSIKARNFQVFRERLEEKGLGGLARDYFECSGQLARACYKEELEAVFRSKLLAGFQILDIQDFSGQGTALVGMLDAFMDNKGIITDEEWREFCNDAVVLARFKNSTLVSGSEFSARTEIASFRPESLDGKTLSWRAELKDGTAAAEGSFEIEAAEGENYLSCGRISFTVPAADRTERLTLKLSVDGTDIRNSYPLEIIPDRSEGKLQVFRRIDAEARAVLKSGGRILLMPEKESENGSIEGFYCQDFWCFPMFASISRMMEKPEPVGTMGLVIDTAHPAVKDFASERYSTPVWWDIVQSSRCEILDGDSRDVRVIVRMIDNFERNHSLALVYEYELEGGTVVVCRSDPEKLRETPEGRHFLWCLEEYVNAETDI
ncbi:MAG: beta-glucuronidase [Ruminococcus sp.]|nr:beta-glucuronidase [Ruminococcus sp.]